MGRLLTKYIILSFLLTLTSLAGARRLGDEKPLELSVRVYDYSQVPFTTFAKATEDARRIFRQSGVETKWIDCSPSAETLPPDAACNEPLGSSDLVLRILPGSPTARLPKGRGDLGVAMLSANESELASYASIFFDRVAELAAGRVSFGAIILGHAMAHEIGHLLLGTGAHSQTGLMRVPWSRSQLEKVTQGGLGFTRWQARKMRTQVRVRMLAQQARLLDGDVESFHWTGLAIASSSKTEPSSTRSQRRAAAP